jgi:hypothetical protein
MPRAALGLLQSPDVWQHYYEHQREESAPLGFLDFLWMHYAADSQHTKQKKHHLPSFDFQGIAGLFVLPSAVISFEKQPVVGYLPKAAFAWHNDYSFLSSRALICPPRA